MTTTITPFALKFSKVRAGEYVADHGTLHIEIDKCASDYLNWQVFITDRPGNLIVTKYTNFADTYREAKELANAWVAAEDIFRNI